MPAMQAQIIAVERNSTALASLPSTFGGATGRFTIVMLKGDAVVENANKKTATPCVPFDRVFAGYRKVYICTGGKMCCR